MTIALELFLALYLVSFLPFLVLGAASIRTELLRLSLHNPRRTAREQPPGKLPMLVRLHIAEVRSLKMCLSISIACLIVFFGLPPLVAGILWPEELPGAFDDMGPAVLLFAVLAILRVLTVSPDPTGGLPHQLLAGEAKAESSEHGSD